MILVKVDRAAVVVSLETRAPLLDHRVLEFALRLTDRHLDGKLLLRGIAEERILAKLLDRPKWGFAIPPIRWFRDALGEPLTEALAPPRVWE